MREGGRKRGEGRREGRREGRGGREGGREGYLDDVGDVLLHLQELVEGEGAKLGLIEHAPGIEGGFHLGREGGREDMT